MSFTLEDKKEIKRFVKEYNVGKEAEKQIGYRVGFENFTGNQKSETVSVLKFRDVESRQAFNKKVHELNLLKLPQDRTTYRDAAGWDDLAEKSSKEYDKSYTQASGVLPADIVCENVGDPFKTIKVIDEENHIVRVGASIKLRELDRQLFKKHGLCLSSDGKEPSYISLLSEATLGGIVDKAGHGTNRYLSNAPGIVVGATVLLYDGRTVHIKKGDPFFDVIMGANVSLFGTILDFDLQCVPRKRFRCETRTMSVPQFRREVEAGLFTRKRVSAMVVHQGGTDELTNETLKNVRVNITEAVDDTTEKENYEPKLMRAFQELGVQGEEKLRVARGLVKLPWLTRPYLRHVVSPAAIGKEDFVTVGPWHGIHSQLAYPNDIKDASFLVTTQDQGTEKEGNKILTIIDKMVGDLDEKAKEGIRPITDALYFRVIEPTPAPCGFSTARGDKEEKEECVVCVDAVTNSEGIVGSEEFFTENQRFFLEDMQGKPHLGKYLVGKVDYQKVFPGASEEFIEAYEYWFETHKLPPGLNPQLTEFFCEMVNLPQYALRPSLSSDPELPGWMSYFKPLKKVGPYFNPSSPAAEGEDNPQLKEELEAMKCNLF